jgi:hypothetical protein
MVPIHALIYRYWFIFAKYLKIEEPDILPDFMKNVMEPTPQFKEEVWECVTKHRTEYNDPIKLSKGEIVQLGELAPEENWKNWIWAINAREQGGWVPLQLVEAYDDNSKGVVLDDYSARELDIDPGELVIKMRSINGWSWVKKTKSNEEGWIPDEVLELKHY